MERFTNNNGEIKKTVPKIYMGRDKELDSISFLSQSGYGSLYIARGNVLMENEYHMTDEAIIKAGYLLCKINPHEFYNFYATIASEHIKDLLKEALKQVKEEYVSVIHSSASPSIFDYQGYALWADKYIVDPSDYEAITICTGFDVDDGALVGGFRQKVGYFTGEKSGIVFYDNDNHENDVCRFNYGVWHKNFTESIVRQNAKLICQSDIKSYQDLLARTNPEDQYYSALVAGGDSFGEKISSLEYTISR